MSRISYCDIDSTEDMLRCCAFEHNTIRHLKGAKGQAALRELEAALLALPDKRLVHSRFVVTSGEEPNGAVCALGAVALYRKRRDGIDRETALKEIAKEAPTDPNDGWYGIVDTANYLRYKTNFVFAVVEANDELVSEMATPESRYEQVLAWCREELNQRV